MSTTVPTVRFSPRLEAEIRERREGITRAYRAGLLTVEEASIAHRKMLEETIRAEAMQLVDGTYRIACKCSYCGNVHVMNSDVIEYHCRCHPNDVQFAHVNPIIIETDIR